MRKLRITGCSDRSMWYAGLIGKLVPFIGEDREEYLSREPAGYVNIVKKADAKVVEYHQVKDAVLSIGGVSIGCINIDAEVLPENDQSTRMLRTFAPVSASFTVSLIGQKGKSKKVQRYKDAKPRW